MRGNGIESTRRKSAGISGRPHTRLIAVCLVVAAISALYYIGGWQGAQNNGSVLVTLQSSSPGRNARSTQEQAAQLAGSGTLAAASPAAADSGGIAAADSVSQQRGGDEGTRSARSDGSALGKFLKLSRLQQLTSGLTPLSQTMSQPGGGSTAAGSGRSQSSVGDVAATAAKGWSSGKAALPKLFGQSTGHRWSSRGANRGKILMGNKGLPCVPSPEAATAAAQAAKYGDQYLAMCLIVRDDHHNIREWIGHHHAVGAGKIYLFDTGSRPPLNETIPDHIKSGLVEYLWWPPEWTRTVENKTSRAYPQLDVYKQCLQRYGDRHQFIAFIDSDEFLILKGDTPSVPALLQRLQSFEPVGGLAVNWVMFGSSGHIQRPEGGMLRSYTQCLPRVNGHTIHIKSIVNTDYGVIPGGPHHFEYKEGFYAVNEHFQRVNGPKFENVTLEKIALHHYVLRSLEEFKLKSERGSAMGNHKPLSFFTGINALATENCTDAVGLGPYN